MRHFGFGLGMAALLLTGSAAALAQAPSVSVTPNEIIDARQAGMSLQGAVAASMKPVAQAKGNPAAFKDGANAIVLWAKAIPGMFPPGTEKGENTEALPAVWSDQAGFTKAAARLGTAATSLSEAAAKGDATAFAAAYQEVGESCGGCHRTYRAKK
jgi:cytochrome c556